MYNNSAVNDYQLKGAVMSAHQNLAATHPPYLQLESFIELMSNQNRDAIQRMLHDHGELFMRAGGSKANHQAWVGGYWDNVCECLNLAIVQYDLWNSLRPRPYHLSEALEVLFVHDLEKPWKYFPSTPCPITVPNLQSKPERARFRLELLAWYGVNLSPEQQNALQYCEGELGEYDPDQRKMQPMAHLCHTCDETSARQFHDYPAAQDDPWEGARRISSAPTARS